MENTILINGVEYVSKDSIKKTATKKAGMPWVVVRTYSAGVHCGYLKSRKLKEVELLEARRLYYWEGAFTLSEIAMKGVSKPENCKFPPLVNSIILTEAIEIIPATEEAKKSILNVKNYES